MINVLDWFVRLQYGLLKPKSESGFTTAELLGNAALGVIALVGIWYAMTELGQGVLDNIQRQLLNTQ